MSCISPTFYGTILIYKIEIQKMKLQKRIILWTLTILTGFYYSCWIYKIFDPYPPINIGIILATTILFLVVFEFIKIKKGLNFFEMINLLTTTVFILSAMLIIYVLFSVVYISFSKTSGFGKDGGLVVIFLAFVYILPVILLFAIRKVALRHTQSSENQPKGTIENRF